MTWNPKHHDLIFPHRPRGTGTLVLLVAVILLACSVVRLVLEVGTLDAHQRHSDQVAAAQRKGLQDKLDELTAQLARDQVTIGRLSVALVKRGGDPGPILQSAQPSASPQHGAMPSTAATPSAGKSAAAAPPSAAPRPSVSPRRTRSPAPTRSPTPSPRPSPSPCRVASPLGGCLIP